MKSSLKEMKEVAALIVDGMNYFSWPQLEAYNIDVHART